MKLVIDQNISFDELKGLVENGAKFISYQYVISVPIFFPTQRLSKLFLIRKNEKPSKYAAGYNFLNILLGIWGLPFGPVFMIRSIALNRKGGVNFTEDVMVNITKEAFISRDVKMKKPAKYFTTPSKSNKKELNKVFTKLRSNKVLRDDVLVGYFINTEKDEKPYHVIGVNAPLNVKLVQQIEEEIYKRFFKFSKFKIVSLANDEYEHINRLKAEGIMMPINNSH